MFVKHKRTPSANFPECQLKLLPSSRWQTWELSVLSHHICFSLHRLQSVWSPRRRINTTGASQLQLAGYYYNYSQAANGRGYNALAVAFCHRRVRWRHLPVLFVCCVNRQALYRAGLWVEGYGRETADCKQGSHVGLLLTHGVNKRGVAEVYQLLVASASLWTSRASLAVKCD